jgi:RNA polymerase sigma-70 factor (ECF subfamily)
VAPAEITVLLTRWRSGDSSAFESLTELVYDKLRSIAAHYLAAERRGHTLSPTSVVHEAYLRLVGNNATFNDRSHFLAMAAVQMRRVLVDHARHRGRRKRGGDDWHRVTLTNNIEDREAAVVDVLEVQQALERLGAIDPRKVEVVDMLMFGGLTVEETAEALGISASTVHREWRVARAWLLHELRSA